MLFQLASVTFTVHWAYHVIKTVASVAARKTSWDNGVIRARNICTIIHIVKVIIYDFVLSFRDLQSDSLCFRDLQSDSLCFRDVQSDSLCFRDVQSDSICFRDLQSDSLCFRDLQSDSLGFRDLQSDSFCFKADFI